MLLILSLHLAIVPVSCGFFKSLISPRSLKPLFGNFLVSIFALHII